MPEYVKKDVVLGRLEMLETSTMCPTMTKCSVMGELRRMILDAEPANVIPMLQCRNCNYAAPTTNTYEQVNCREERRYQ